MWGRRAHFKAILPASVDVEAFLGTAAGALYASGDLMEAATRSPDSLIVAMMRCAALGHMPGTDEFYLTPRKKKGVPQVLGIEGYRGVIERMYRSGAVAKVVVREVCAKDQFRYSEGADDKPVHSFGGEGTTGADFFGAAGFRDRGPMVGVYAYAQLTTGAYSRPVILNRADVEAARDAGGWKPDDPFSPWNRYDAGKDHPEFQGRSMWWKTAAKRLEPWVPTSAEYRREQLRASASAAAAAAPAGSAPPSWTPAPAAAGPDDIHDAEVVDDQAAAQPPRAERDPIPAPSAGAPEEGPAAPARATTARPAPETASAGQLATIARHFARLGFGDGERDQRLAAISTIIGRDIASTKELTAAEAKTVTGILPKCKDRDQLTQLLVDGDKPSGGDS
jgi:recombination protein RecT